MSGRLTPTERETLIAAYRDGHAAVLAAVAGASDEELDSLPAAPDEWTARQVVHHLADSETISAYRLRRLIVEDSPLIEGYDEPAYARVLFYADRPIGPSLDALGAARATTVQILERLTDDQWARTGRHSEAGEYGVETWLGVYARHAHEHADQIRRALETARAARGPAS
jgi:DinB superfamily